MLTIAAAIAVGSSFGAINHLPLPPNRNEFDFVVLGDNRPAGSGQPITPVFREILRDVGYIHPAFVFSLGDLLYGNEESFPTYVKECTEMSRLLDRFPIPVFNAPGNHELAKRQEFADRYVKTFGKLYGSFDYGGCRFIAVCTDEIGYTAGISKEQSDWIAQTLQSDKPTFVGMHRPMFAREGVTEAGASIQGADALSTEFAAHNVKAVFEAHDHVFHHAQRDGIDYFISGGAGAPLDADPQDGGFFHFILVHVKDGKPTYHVLPLGAIQVAKVGDVYHVDNYSNSDVHLGDLTLHATRRPQTATASVDKKGKLKAVAISITRIEKASGGFTVHLAFDLTKHRQTLVQIR